MLLIGGCLFGRLLRGDVPLKERGHFIGTGENLRVANRPFGGFGFTTFFEFLA